MKWLMRQVKIFPFKQCSIFLITINLPWQLEETNLQRQLQTKEAPARQIQQPDMSFCQNKFLSANLLSGCHCVH